MSASLSFGVKVPSIFVTKLSSSLSEVAGCSVGDRCSSCWPFVGLDEATADVEPASCLKSKVDGLDDRFFVESSFWDDGKPLFSSGRRREGLLLWLCVVDVGI